MLNFIERCECSHDKDSHFERKHSCLCMGCSCLAYLKEGSDMGPTTDRAPADSKTSRFKPHLNYACECPACVEWANRKFSFPF